MFDTARKYFVENVLTSYHEFIDHQKHGDWGESQLLRKGINSAVSLYHVREHLPAQLQPTRTDLHAYCNDYAILGDIVNVSKHGTIDRNNPSIMNASQIYECLAVTFYQDDIGEYNSPRLDVHVRLNDGTLRFLSDILFNVMLMWNEKLADLGVLNFKKPEPLNHDVPISRETANQWPKMQMTQGEEYKLHMEVFKYNYATMRAESMNMSGKRAFFLAFKPVESVDIEVCIPDSGLHFDYKLPLTKEQSIEYTQLDTTAQKNAFIQKVVMANADIQRDINKEISERSKKTQ